MSSDEPTFVRTRHHYPSYDDFWRLVEVSGFATCYLDQMEGASPRTFITTPFNGETPLYLARPREARVVFLHMERTDAPGAPQIGQQVDECLRYVDEIWAQDRSKAALDPRIRFVPMGAHPEMLTATTGPDRIYDFAHVSYAWGRREALYNAISALGLSSPPAQGSVALERDPHLVRTKIMVNAQQYPSARVVAPLRFALAAAARMALVSEPLEEPYPLERGVHYMEAPIEELPALVRRLSADPATCRRLGEALHDRLCYQHSFRRGVMEAISAEAGG